MKSLPPCEIWYVTGSQHLYGEEALKQVAATAVPIVEQHLGHVKGMVPAAMSAN